MHTHTRAHSKRAPARADAVFARRRRRWRPGGTKRSLRSASRTHGSATGCASPDRIHCLLHVIRSALSAARRRLHYICSTLSFPRSHGICCISPTTRCLFRLLHAVACIVVCHTLCAATHERTHAATHGRAYTRARTHTRACESMRIGMVGNGAGAGGSQAGGRGAAPVATSLSCACRRRHVHRTN